MTEIVASPGKGADVAQKVTALRDALSSSTGLEWSAWTNIAGRPFGSFGLTTRSDGFAEMIGARSKAIADSTFTDISAELGALTTGPSESHVMEVVGASGEIDPSMSLASLTRASMSGGGVERTLAWAHRLAQHVTEVSGVGLMVVTSAAGKLFDVGWVAGYADGAAYDEARAKLAADPGYAALVDEGAGLVIEDSVESNVVLRLP